MPGQVQTGPLALNLLLPSLLTSTSAYRCFGENRCHVSPTSTQIGMKQSSGSVGQNRSCLKRKGELFKTPLGLLGSHPDLLPLA